MIDKDMAEILKAAGLGQDACWKHKQSGKWIIYHWACERAAAHKGIAFDPPVIIYADPAEKFATICVTGHLGDKEQVGNVEYVFPDVERSGRLLRPRDAGRACRN